MVDFRCALGFRLMALEGGINHPQTLEYPLNFSPQMLRAMRTCALHARRMSIFLADYQ